MARQLLAVRQIKNRQLHARLRDGIKNIIGDLTTVLEQQNLQVMQSRADVAQGFGRKKTHVAEVQKLEMRYTPQRCDQSSGRYLWWWSSTVLHA